MRYAPTLISITFFSVIAGYSVAEENRIARNEQTIEVAFVLDTTGSMAGLIDGAKQKIWSIANTIVDVNPDADIKMALIGYRDFGDDYVIKPYQMSTDIQALYGNLTRFSADGGGDTPEAVNEALDKAVHSIGWSSDENTRKILFLVGDAPPHMDYQGPQYPAILQKARAKGIIVNTIQAGDYDETRKFWLEMAQIGGGRYIQIEQDGGQVRHIPTPYDDQIIQLQVQIDATVIPYGNERLRREVEGKMSEKGAASDTVVLENSSFYSKRSSVKEVITGGGDLIGDVRNGYRKLDDIGQEELPKNLQGKSQQELQAYIQQRSEAREKLEAEMLGLVQKRDAFIAEEAAKTSETNSFDAVVSRTLKEQLQ